MMFLSKVGSSLSAFFAKVGSAIAALYNRVRAIKLPNYAKLIILAVLAVAAVVCFMLIGLNFAKASYVQYSMKIRVPKLIAMLIAAFAIGAASIVFQTIISNRIVTPCLLGMNSLYTLTHVALVFIVGTGSVLITNSNIAFAIDLVIMVVVSFFIYGFMFKKTKYNILYILLIGTVLTSLFSSIQSTLVMIMDPTDYEVTLQSLVASFENIDSTIMIAAVCILALVAGVLFKDLRVLDVMSLGKAQAINLGVNFDKTVNHLLLGVTAYIAVATAMVGPISFLGLIIANLARELLRTFRHWQLILGSSLFGVIVLAFGELLVEQAFDYSVPISVFISLIGGAYFLYLIIRQPKHGGARSLRKKKLKKIKEEDEKVVRQKSCKKLQRQARRQRYRLRARKGQSYLAHRSKRRRQIYGNGHYKPPRGARFGHSRLRGRRHY